MHLFAAMAVITGLAMLPGRTGPGPGGPEIGKPAPAFTLLDAQGQKHSLSDYKGKTVVIEWVNIACPNPQSNYASGLVPELQKKYTGKDVVWLSVVMTGKQTGEDGDVLSEDGARSMAKDMVEKYGAAPTTTLIDVDGTIGDAYDTRTSMHMFVVDKNGILTYDGALDDAYDASGSGGWGEPSPVTKNYVTMALDEALAGKPVTTSKTMPYGCHPIDGHPLVTDTTGVDSDDGAGK